MKTQTQPQTESPVLEEVFLEEDAPKYKGWNMHSVIDLIIDETERKRRQPDQNDVMMSHEAMVKAISFRMVANMAKDARVRQAVEKESAELDESLVENWMGFTVKHGEYPPGFEDIKGSGLYVELAQMVSAMIESHRTSLECLRAIADKLNFLLMPFADMDERGYKGESKKMQDTIANFNKLSRFADVYAIAPMNFFSLKNRIASENSLSLRAPKNYEQTFLALEMVTPMLREIKGDVGTLQARMREMQKQLDRIEKRLEEERLARIEAERVAWNTEPMMFAVAKGTNLDSNGLAIIGPCWGKDMGKILLASLEFEADSVQRAAIERNVRKLFG